MPESKHERFVRIAEARTNKIIDMVKLLGNCSNKGTYDYDADEVKKIFNAIDDELRKAKAKFETNGNEDKKFRLK